MHSLKRKCPLSSKRLGSSACAFAHLSAQAEVELGGGLLALSE